MEFIHFDDRYEVKCSLQEVSLAMQQLLSTESGRRKFSLCLADAIRRRGWQSATTRLSGYLGDVHRKLLTQVMEDACTMVGIPII